MFTGIEEYAEAIRCGVGPSSRSKAREVEFKLFRYSALQPVQAILDIRHVSRGQVRKDITVHLINQVPLLLFVGRGPLNSFVYVANQPYKPTPIGLLVGFINNVESWERFLVLIEVPERQPDYSPDGTPLDSYEFLVSPCH